MLRESDDRSGFDSGDPELDRFFRRFAGQNQFRHHIGVTYVAVDGPRILGYATIAPGQIEVEDLPAKERKKFPQYPLPVLRLARLAVAASARGKGLGAQLLRFVLGLAVRMAGDYGCVGVVVDAKPAAVDFYTKYGFAPFELIEGQGESRPSPMPMLLGMRAIQEGLE